MSEQFHQQLNQLALDLQQDSLTKRQRQKIIGDIYRIIVNSLEFKKYKYRLFNYYKSKNSDITKAVFEDCYAYALTDTAIEVLQQKINNYNPGEGYILDLDWQQFKRDLQNNPENSSTLAKGFIEKIDCYRQTVDESLKAKKDFRQEQSEKLESTCTELADSIAQAVEMNNYSLEKLELLWNHFTKQILTCDQAKNLFHWFIFILRRRFLDQKNEALGYRFTNKGGKKILHSPTKSIYDPISNDGQRTIVDTVADKEKPDRTLQDLIEKDPDGIFTAKHLKNYPEVNFREIQRLHFQNCSCEEILVHFNNRVSLGSISSHYSRSQKYFRPILEEYLEGQFPLTESAIAQICKDQEINQGARRTRQPSAITMNQRSDINFRNIIIHRKENFFSWQLLAEHLNISPKDLILFYLDNLQKSGLYQTVKERKQ